MDFRVDDWEAYAATGGGTLGGVDVLAFDDADNRGLSSCLASGGTSLAQAYAKYVIACHSPTLPSSPPRG